MLFTVAALVLVAQLLLLLALRVNAGRTIDLADVDELDPPAGAPTVLVIVPARNEEANIGACVEALAASSHPALAIRIVDDHSTDRTAAIVERLAARDPRITLLRSAPLPPGWLGKPHALHQGAAGAGADWLLFVDADLVVARACVSRAVAAAAGAGADLLALVPAMEARTFWERAVQPLVTLLICALTPVREVNDPARPEAAATGPFLLFRREAYEAIGGHASVRGEVVEDLQLARLIKAAGRRILWTRGPSLARLRMYDSLGAIVRGWSKNMHAAFGRALYAAPLAAAALLVFFAGPFLLPVAAYAVAGPTPGTDALVEQMAVHVAAVFACVALFASHEVAVRFYRVHHLGRRDVLLIPLGAAVLAYVLLDAAVRAATGRTIQWKGRAVR